MASVTHNFDQQGDFSNISLSNSLSCKLMDGLEKEVEYFQSLQKKMICKFRKNSEDKGETFTFRSSAGQVGTAAQYLAIMVP